MGKYDEFWLNFAFREFEKAIKEVEETRQSRLVVRKLSYDKEKAGTIRYIDVCQYPILTDKDDKRWQQRVVFVLENIKVSPLNRVVTLSMCKDILQTIKENPNAYLESINICFQMTRKINKRMAIVKIFDIDCLAECKDTYCKFSGLKNGWHFFQVVYVNENYNYRLDVSDTDITPFNVLDSDAKQRVVHALLDKAKSGGEE